MSHHLTRLTDAKLLKVRIDATGRPVKYYSINESFTDEIVIEGTEDETKKQAILFLQSASAHLQVISSLMQERADYFMKHVKKKGKSLAKKSSVTFTFSFLSDEESKVWNEEYERFQQRVKTRLADVRSESPESSPDYIAFGGITPTRTPK